MNTAFKNVDDYIKSFPSHIQKLLKEIRAAIKAKAPEAVESISYGMPAYKLNGKPLVYFAGFKNHIGFYATPTGHEAFAKELAKYKQGKGSVQFPLDQPLPLDLIRRIVAFRVEQNQPAGNKSRQLKTCPQGHQFYKSSDCPTCPICEKERKLTTGFLSKLASPARRALENNGIKTIKQLSKLTEKEVLRFHGIGKTSIPLLKSLLQEQHLDFKQQS